MKRTENLLFVVSRYLHGHEKALITAVLCSLVTGACVAFQPLIIKYVVDDGISNDALSPQRKLLVVGGLCAVYILVSLIRVRSYRLGYMRMLSALEGALVKLKSELFFHVERMGMKFHAEYSSGELQNYLNGTPITSIRAYLSSIISNVPYQIISMVISLAALLKYDWVMTVVLLATTILMAVLNFYAQKKIRRISADYVKTESEANRYLIDTLSGMDAVKIYSIEESVHREYDSTLRRVRDALLHLNTENMKQAQKAEMAQYVGVSVIYFVGAVSCIFRNTSTGTLYAFLSSMTAILSTLSTWLQMGLQRSSAQSGMDAIMDILHREIDVPNLPPEQCADIRNAQRTAAAAQTPCIRFDHVCFAYENTEIFRDFSCQLRRGESVALVGASGSGKSTFSKLLLRLYDVQSGSVELYGHNVKDYDLHELRTRFGVVPQNTAIFYGTVWSNVKIARPEATDEEVHRAMAIAHVNDFLGDLEHGCDTVVGNGGRELSGGQRQRIGIARAVLGKPDILVFDEATSALDNLSEQAIQHAMEDLMKEHTVIMIAHRLTTIRNVDRVMVFDHGRIVEDGSYQALAEKENGVFHRMLTLGETT